MIDSDYNLILILILILISEYSNLFELAGVYNGENNACAGHGPQQPSSLNLESIQLQLDGSFASRSVRWCPSWRDSAAQTRFERQGPEIICRNSKIERE